MDSSANTLGNRIFRYDRGRRRLWIAGQRIHHGMTGALVAAAGLTALAARRLGPRPGIEAALVGTLLMAHDWDDRSIWFQAGHQNQP